MKITDNNLLSAIWINQLKLIPNKIIQRYAGDKYSLSTDNSYWYYNAISEHRSSCERITDKLSRPQLLKRIKKLIDTNQVKTTYPKDMLLFCIDNDIAKSAYHYTRKFWIENGMAEGITQSRINTISATDIDFNGLKAKCEAQLIELYGSIDSKAYERPNNLLKSI